MEIDWPALLTDIRVEWRDRGANSSRGNVNIRCPKCGDADPSHHMGIALAKEAYFCYREPNRHSGRSFVGLLMALGQTRDSAARLLNRYRLSGGSAAITPPSAIPKPITRAWDRFQPASHDPGCLAYLGGRGFGQPRSVCEHHDLRFAPVGVWAKRLLIPFTAGNAVVSWTGRAVSGHHHPKYLTHDIAGFQPIYCPDEGKAGARDLVVTEGPMDALKIAYAMRFEPILAIALCGSYLGPQKLRRLRELAKGVTGLFLALDADANPGSAFKLLADLAAAIKPRHAIRLRMPYGYKDPAEIPMGEIKSWIENARQRLAETG